MLGIVGIVGVALGQAVPEGDFESPGDLTGWTLAGQTFRITEQDSSILGGRVMNIDRASGPAQACSPAFVVTRSRVAALMKSINATGDNELWLQEPGSAVRLATVTVSPYVLDYRTYELDVTSACGATVQVCVQPGVDDEIAYDAFVLDQAPCALYLDEDGDGACIVGRDADGDGSCADAGELDDPAFDCDDQDATVSSLAVEACDAVDNDCDGVVDEGFDEDADGYTTCAGDCDDGDGGAFPGAVEVCNGIDDDCEGGIDEDFDLDLDGYTTCAGDCDDDNVNVFDGAPEQCNGIDDDCDYDIDEDVATSPWWPDGDGDGFGDEATAPVEDCLAPDGWVSNGDDCDDGDPDVNPRAPDLAADGVDDDCDGRDGPPPGTTTTSPTEPTETADTGDTGGGGTDTTSPEDPGLDGDPAVAVQVGGCGCGVGGGSLGGALVPLLALGLAVRRRDADRPRPVSRHR
jgi:MYXO-CTERM domain-containing protein